MLNKELILNPQKKVLPYTHIVHVEYDEWHGNVGYDSEELLDSRITPPTMSLRGVDCPIYWLVTDLKSSGNTYLDIGARNVPQTDIYVGRSDIGKSYGVGRVHFWDDSQDADLSSITWDAKKIFSALDAGKEIPIWLSTTPPPY